MSTGTERPYMLSCDWGTSSFRLSLVNYQTGKVLDGITSPDGIKSISHSPTGSSFRIYLASQIAKVEKQSSYNLEFVPIIISGMASSSIGWRELPYGRLPFSLDDPQLPVEKIEATQSFPHEVVLISGICSEDDVMRGEETQVLGLANQYNLKNVICVLPGTHSKHVYIENNRITQFNTYLTGELFELIATQSILNNSVTPSEANGHGDAFRKGVTQASGSNFLHNLFSIRAADLLHQSNQKKNYEFLSGLLIGSELKELQPHRGKKIYLVGATALQHRYVTALEVLGINSHPVKNTSELTIKGHRFIFNLINQKDKHL